MKAELVNTVAQNVKLILSIKEATLLKDFIYGNYVRPNDTVDQICASLYKVLNEVEENENTNI